MATTLPRQLATYATASVLVVLLAVFTLLPDSDGPRGGGLAPATAASPRDTVEGFRSDVNQAASLLTEAYHRHREEPGLFWSDEAKATAARAEALFVRAGRYLDLREIPPTNLASRRLEATLLLKEIMDRLQLPPTADIPGREATADGRLARWTLPGTEIQIVRIQDGPRAGDYLFSPDTVHRLEEFYDAVRDQAEVDGAAADFYAFYSQSPGRLMPPKWFVVIDDLPGPFKRVIWEQAAWQWIALAIVIGLALLALAGVRRGLHWLQAGDDGPASLPASLIAPASIAVATLFVLEAASVWINITGTPLAYLEDASDAIAYCAMIWGVLSFTGALASRVAGVGTASGRGLDAHLVRAAIRMVGIAGAIALFVNGASQLGIPLAGILAGLGVGGLAIALAAKPTLENLICGLILYADQPVRVGDYCRFDKFEGRIEDIGFRSTRVRAPDRTVITIPNATFVNMSLVNLSNRDRMPYTREIRLRRASDAASIREEMESYAALVASHPMIEAGSVDVRLKDVHDEHPKADIRALIRTSQWSEFIAIRHEIDLMLRDAPMAPESKQPADETASRPTLQIA